MRGKLLESEEWGVNCVDNAPKYDWFKYLSFQERANLLRIISLLERTYDPRKQRNWYDRGIDILLLGYKRYAHEQYGKNIEIVFLSNEGELGMSKVYQTH